MANRTATLYADIDATLLEATPDDNSGTGNLGVGYSAGNELRTVIEFDFASIPLSGEIVSATLYLNVASYAPSAESVPLRAYCIYEQPWLELQATWNSRVSADEWLTAGGIDSDQVGIAETTLNPGDSVISFNITEAAYDWHKGRIQNTGMIIAATQTVGELVYFESKGAVASIRPRIAVTYSHHETVSQERIDRWRAVAVLPNGTTIYDGNLAYNPTEIGCVQEVPTESSRFDDENTLYTVTWKGSDSEDYEGYLETDPIDGMSFERSMVPRKLDLTFPVVTYDFVNLWWKWMEFGCIVTIYPAQRYDATAPARTTLGLEGTILFPPWPFIDPDESVRIWQNGTEIYNNSVPETWNEDYDGGRFTNGILRNPEDEFLALYRNIWKVRIIDVLPSYHATHLNEPCGKSKTSVLQVVCLEEDFAERQFGEEVAVVS